MNGINCLEKPLAVLDKLSPLIDKVVTSVNKQYACLLYILDH